MNYTQTEPPTKLPVTLDEIKAHMHETSTGQDAVIERLYLPAAIDAIADHTGRALTTQTWVARLDAWPCFGEPVTLAYPPLVSVTHVKYYDANGTLQTLDPAQYQVDIYSAPGRIVLATGASWPQLAQRINPIEITFVCGYGASSNKVPDKIRLAVAMTAAHFYDNREAFAKEAMHELPGGVRELLDKYVRYAF